jgi:hypothetical protein
MEDLTEAEQRALIAQFEDGGRRFAERVEKNPWTHELRAVLAEYERTGAYGPVEDFVRRFKANEAQGSWADGGPDGGPAASRVALSGNIKGLGS